MVPQAGGKQRLVFEAPSRGLIGFRSAFATLTRGTGILHRAFARYGRFKGALDGVRKGVLISTAGARLPRKFGTISPLKYTLKKAGIMLPSAGSPALGCTASQACALLRGMSCLLLLCDPQAPSTRGCP